ncbi:unnamed protein product, partial [Mesorhabditis spiculigera]
MSTSKTGSSFRRNCSDRAASTAVTDSASGGPFRAMTFTVNPDAGSRRKDRSRQRHSCSKTIDQSEQSLALHRVTQRRPHRHDVGGIDLHWLVPNRINVPVGSSSTAADWGSALRSNVTPEWKYVSHPTWI